MGGSGRAADGRREARRALPEDPRGARHPEDVKGGAGQYFTPRPLIDAIVEVVKPAPKEVICDPACGTGGFLLSAHAYLSDPENYKLDRAQKKHLKYEALRGVELVEGVARLCAMNLYLHGIGPDDALMTVPIESGQDALRNPPKELVEVVLTNPPFGKKSSITVVTEEGDTDKQSLTYNRTDFWTTTSNKQLNFVQHVKSLLKMGGRAAVVVPDRSTRTGAFAGIPTTKSSRGIRRVSISSGCATRV